MEDAQSFVDLVRREASLAEIARHLDALEEGERVRQIRALKGADQRRLWRAAKGKGALTLEGFVSAVERTVIYEGKNILPIFSLFQKRFFRSGAGAVFGYNENSAFVTFFAGPGYFTVRGADDGELAFDYTDIPGCAPEGWPPLRANDGFVPAIVYGGMIDYVRFVSQDTVIGAAFRAGKPRHQYFVLTRVARS